MKILVSKLARKPKLLVSAFALTICVTLFFAVRLLMFSLYWNDIAHRDQAIEGWMTPRYIALSWDLPRAVVSDALKLPEHPSAKRRVTLEQIAQDQNIPVSALSARLLEAISVHRKTQGD